MGIRVEDTSPRKVGAYTVHRGRVAAGQIGYRAMKEAELEPVVGPEGAHGYRSRGKFSVHPERGSRGATMFSAVPLTPEEMKAHGYTHQIEADLSGLRFRTLKEPVGGEVHADLGLGLGVKGEMDWGRITRLWGPQGEITPDSAPHIGQQFKDMIFEDTGERPGGK